MNKPRQEQGSGALPETLMVALRQFYNLAGVNVTREPQRESEGNEYGACRLHLDGRAVVFRVAKTTPTKVGQFVTLWQRPAPGREIAPLDSSDDVDVVIVSVADAEQRGQFVFDRAALLKYGVMSLDGKGGKRAIRVYPPWSTPLAKAALKSQQWQLRYFVALAPQQSGAPERLRELLHTLR